MYVPEDVERRILDSESPVQASVTLHKELLTTILRETAGSGVPLGVNVESLSIFKEEIDAAHELFQSLQALMLNSRGSPWAVRWFCVRRSMAYAAARASEDALDQYEAHAIEVAEANRARTSSASSTTNLTNKPSTTTTTTATNTNATTTTTATTATNTGSRTTAKGTNTADQTSSHIMAMLGLTGALVTGIIIGRISTSSRI